MKRGAWRAVVGVAVVLAAGLGLGGCAGKSVPASITVRNDSMQAVDVRYAVLGADGNPASTGEDAIKLMNVGAGGASTQTIDDPTGQLASAQRGRTVVRAFVVPTGGGPESAQVLDLTMPPPFVIRVSPMGGGFKAERVEERAADDRQYRDLTTQPPPQPGRGTRP